MSVGAVAIALPWGKIIVFTIDLIKAWMSANDENKKKLAKLLEEYSERLNKFNEMDAGDITDWFDDVHSDV